MKVIRTREELEQEIKIGVDEIIVEGDLAKYIHTSKKIIKLSKYTLIFLCIAIGATIATGGAASFVAAPIAAASGVEITLIFAVVFIGIWLILELWDKYEEVEFSSGPFKMKLKKKR